jgi:hypothetical protein
MPKRKDLRETIMFAPVEDGLVGKNMMWPKKDDVLLRAPVAGETYVYGDELWVEDDLERLVYHALQFAECARNLVKLWLPLRGNSPNVAYVIGYLYRHAIELQLKAMLGDTAAFRAETARRQQQALQTHSIAKLWYRLRPLLRDICDDAELGIITARLLELDDLDQRSDGFRYPFSFDPDTGVRTATLDGFTYASFDNFVWVLESLIGWLTSLEDRMQG